jgi:hypothetical protein
MFKLPADFPFGGQRSRHAADARRPARRADGEGRERFYMIGLSNMDADKGHNMQLLKERAWFDIPPLVYGNSRRAILALETHFLITHQLISQLCGGPSESTGRLQSWSYDRYADRARALISRPLGTRVLLHVT